VTNQLSSDDDGDDVDVDAKDITHGMGVDVWSFLEFFFLNF
jgi:hypothetical protein